MRIFFSFLSINCLSLIANWIPFVFICSKLELTNILAIVSISKTLDFFSKANDLEKANVLLFNFKIVMLLSLEFFLVIIWLDKNSFSKKIKKVLFNTFVSCENAGNAKIY